MNPPHDLEARIADYYQAEAPSRAPDWVLARALGTIDTTPQRRARFGQPWSLPRMSFRAKASGGAIAIVTIAATGLAIQGLPVVGPAAPASPPPLTERFESPRNGFLMDYPAGWQTRPAIEPWTSRGLTFDEPGADIIFDPARGEDLYFAVASEPLGSRGYREWPASIRNTFSSCDTFAALGCARSMLLTRDTRGYAVVLYLADEGLADTYSEGWFQSVLDTLELRPEDEAPAPASYQSSSSSSPSAPLPPPLTERFDSEYNGMSLAYPAGWQTKPATGIWASRALAFDEQDADVIFDPTYGQDLYLAVASEPIRGRAGDETWATGVTLPTCPGGHAGSVLTFDGASGWVVQCGDGPVLHSAILNTETRGYAIVLYVGEMGIADTYDWPFFRSILETLDVHPEEAAATTHPSPSSSEGQ